MSLGVSAWLHKFYGKICTIFLEVMHALYYYDIFSNNITSWLEPLMILSNIVNTHVHN